VNQRRDERGDKQPDHSSAADFTSARRLRKGEKRVMLSHLGDLGGLFDCDKDFWKNFLQDRLTRSE
jgi:hypothetical protein